MLTSFALVFLLGLGAAALCKQVHLPRIIGMLLVGILIGPHVWNLLDNKILSVSSELRGMALIIILIKAGLSLNIEDLKKVGRPALLLSFLPATFEIIGFVLLAPAVLGISPLEAAIAGAVLGAVSPAVVVPKMVQLMDEQYGTEKGIPQMILAGASLDDVFVIVLFSTFVGIAQGETASAMDFLNIPISIVLGILLGVGVGVSVAAFFEKCHKKGKTIRNSTKVILLLAIAFVLDASEDWLAPYVAVSGLLAVMSMACAIRGRCPTAVVNRLAAQFGKLWIAAEVLLFVLVGAAVDIRYSIQAGPRVILMIFIALVFRSLGTALCVVKTQLNRKERLFCIIAYLPKATVQAAIGSVPLSLGLPCGSLVLTIAVLSILLTAPLGALGMDATYRTFLHCDKPQTVTD